MPFNTLADDLQRLVDATDAIGQAIIDVGGTVNEYDRLEEYPADIKSINRNTTSIDITENGSYYAGEENTITTTAFPITIRNSVGTPMKHVTVDGNMQQNGTPTPQNPIQPNETGEMTDNLFDYARMDGIIAKSFINQSGSIVANDEYYISYPISVTVGETYTWRFNPDSYNTTHTSPTVGFYDASDNLLSVALHYSGIKYFSFSIPNGCKYIRCSVFTRDNIQRQAMLNVGSSPKRYTDFGYRIPISSGDTTTSVYLGEVETTRKIKKLVLTGQEDWSISNNERVLYTALADHLTSNELICYCSHYKSIANVSAMSALSNGECTFNNTLRWFYIKDDNYNDAVTFKTYLQQQYSAGTPVTVWYVLANPETTVVNEPLRKIGDYADTVSADINLPLSSTEPNIVDIETSPKASSASFTYNIKNEYIGYNEINVDVPNTYTVADEGKVVSNGSLVSQTAKPTEITTNDTYDTTTYNSVTVNVENSYTASDEGKVVSNGTLVAQTAKPETITSNNTYVTTLYNSVNVNVPNTYTQSDEGKVVSNGSLVSQTAKPDVITANNTYDTTLYNSVTVNISSELQEPKDVNFYDYEGTLVKSYTATEFANISGLPNNPSHAGLTAQGWNWSLADAKAYVAKYKKLNIGQMYITSDGKTRIYITLTEGRTSPILQLYMQSPSELDIDWGDGSSHSTFISTASFVYVNERHNYATPGSYVIAIAVISGSFVLQNSASNVSSILWNGNNSSTSADVAYNNSIKKIEIGTGVVNLQSAFRNCYSLTSITIPNTITSLGSSSFNGCYSLSSITIPDSVTGISGYMFQNCYALSSVTIPNTVTGELNNTFNGCYSLSSITIPDSVTGIRYNAFKGCSSLSSITIPNGVTSIGASAFNGCYSLSSITIPNTVTSFSGTQTFEYCYSLTSITIPNGVTSIGNFTFYQCYSLTSITIPNTITSIGTHAFDKCTCMESIKFKPTTPPTVSDSNAWTDIPTTCIIYVPRGSLNAYKTATNYPNPSTYTYVEY